MEDRVWQAMVSAVAHLQPKDSPQGWLNFSCPICLDDRLKCGIKNYGTHSQVKCFHCDFRAKWQMGYRLSANMKEFFQRLAVPEKEIKLLALWAERLCKQISADPKLQKTFEVTPTPNFPTISLPAGAHPLKDWADAACVDRNFLAVSAYLLSRGDEAARASVYYWTPEMPRRLIIPCYHHDCTIGWIARTVDDKKPRYLKELPPNVLFNARFLRGPRHYVFIVEGAFDALVIDGVASLGASLNAQQINWINQSGKQPILVPDRDTAGKQLVEVAIQQGWGVAMPHYGRHQWWDAGVKDAADAVLRYGKLYVVQSILATQEYHPGKIQQSMKYLSK